MVDFCHISPVEYLCLVKGRPSHLALAHLVEEDQQYADFYKNESGVKILDNSAFEMYKQKRDMYDPSKLLEMAERVKANYIVMTDYPGKSSAKGIKIAKEQAPIFKEAGYGTFFVPQSRVGDLDDLISAYMWAAQAPEVGYIGFSILGIPNAYGVEKKNKLQRFLARWKFMQELDKTDFWRLARGKRMHLLGMVDGPNEIELLSPWLQNFQTWDSSAAVWAGLNGVAFDSSPTGLVDGKFELEVDFAHKVWDNSISTVLDNMRVIDKLCQSKRV